MRSSQMFKLILGVAFLCFANSCAINNTSLQVPKPDTPAEVAKVSIIQKISFIEEENYTRIHIEGSETLASPFYKLLPDPLRIVIDVPNIDLKQIKEPIKIDNGTIGDVLPTQYDDKGRIEIGLTQMANYNISKEDKNLIIDIEKVKRTAEANEVKEEIKEEDIAEGKGIKISPAELKKEETLQPQPVVTASLPESVRKAKAIIKFLLEEKKDFIIFNIVADGRLGNYNSFKLDSPSRLVLDIFEVGTRYPQKSLKIKNPFIKEVRIGRHPDKLRVVFDSLKPNLPPYQINRIDDKLVVSFGNVPQPSEPQIFLQDKTTKEELPSKVGEPSAISAKVQAEAPKASEVLVEKVKPSVLTGIDFKQMDNKSRIVIALSMENPKFESSMISKQVIAVDIKNAFVPKHLQRGLDTSEFDSAVNYIDLKNVIAGKMNDIRILINLREEMPFETSLEGKALFIDIEKPKKAEAKTELPSAPKKEEVVSEAKKEEIKKEEEKAVPEPKKAEKTAPPAEEKPKLSLDFKDADIKNILRLIAEVSNYNILAGDDVTGKITMRLVDIPWDKALDIVLEHRGLAKIEKENVIRIVSRDTLQKEKQAKFDLSRIEEKIEKLEEGIIWVNYSAAKDLIPQIKNILSEGKGKIEANERTNSLVIIDTPENILKVTNLVKKLDTKTPQVLIEARIVEANLTFQQELGVKWGFLVGGGKATARGGLIDPETKIPTNKLVDLPAVPKVGTAGIIEFLFSRGTIKELDIAISAHENKGEVKIISSPKIATLDNKQASIEQGLRIPIRKVDPQSGQISTEFIEANVKLTVTPQVTNDGHIKLKITAKKDAPDYTVVVDNVPSIDKKEAITEVLIKDGGVVVIAGIYTIEKTEGVEGIPLLSKIPLLGWLFKRESKEDKRRDLLIFISPKILKDQV